MMFCICKAGINLKIEQFHKRRIINQKSSKNPIKKQCNKIESLISNYIDKWIDNVINNKYKVVITEQEN